MQYQEVLPGCFCSRLATSPLSCFCLLQDQSIFEKRGAVGRGFGQMLYQRQKQWYHLRIIFTNCYYYLLVTAPKIYQYIMITS